MCSYHNNCSYAVNIKNVVKYQYQIVIKYCDIGVVDDYQTTAVTCKNIAIYKYLFGTEKGLCDTTLLMCKKSFLNHDKT